MRDPLYDHYVGPRHEAGYVTSGQHYGRRRVRFHAYVDDTASTAQYLTPGESVKLAGALLWHSVPRIAVLVATVATLALLLLVAAGDAWSAPRTAERAANDRVGARTFWFTFERWDTSDVFADGDLRERSCRAYTATKWKCRYVITGYTVGRVVTHIERGDVKVRCRGRCRAFRLIRRSVTDVTPVRVDTAAASE